MRNVCKKIGKIFGIMSVFLFSIWNKVLAINLTEMPIGNLNPSEYGVPSPSHGRLIIDKIFVLGKILIIPLIILIGLFIYYKKKDKEKYAERIIIIKRLLIIISVILIIIGGLYAAYLLYNK